MGASVRCFGTVSPLLLSFPSEMRTLVQEESIKVPRDVKITIKSKVVEVEGKHGKLTRNFKHLPIELYVGDNGKKVCAKMYFAKSKQLSMLRSVCSHINNLFDGVTKKYEYRMRLVYAHFPINATIVAGGKILELRNFLGEKRVRIINMLEGVRSRSLRTPRTSWCSRALTSTSSPAPLPSFVRAVW